LNQMDEIDQNNIDSLIHLNYIGLFKYADDGQFNGINEKGAQR
jgi:hypothetical protein